MGFIDIIIAFIILAGLYRGFQAGLVKTSVALVGWFVALVAATRLADDVAPYLVDYVSSPVLQLGMAFIIIVLVVMLVMQIFSIVVANIIQGLNLGLVDKFTGGILGCIKNTMVVLVMLSISAPVLIKTPMWQSSVIAPELMPYAPFAKDFTAYVFGQAWEQIDATDDSIEDNTKSEN